MSNLYCSRCRCRRGLVDGHGQKSSDIVKTTFHESLMLLPLEQSDAILNDRLRTSQCYPGSIVRSFWEAMQSTSTRDGLLNFNFNLLYSYHLD